MGYGKEENNKKLNSPHAATLKLYFAAIKWRPSSERVSYHKSKAQFYVKNPLRESQLFEENWINSAWRHAESENTNNTILERDTDFIIIVRLRRLRRSPGKYNFLVIAWLLFGVY
jgi:hypothetical protein